MRRAPLLPRWSCRTLVQNAGAEVIVDLEAAVKELLLTFYAVGDRPGALQQQLRGGGWAGGE